MRHTTSTIIAAPVAEVFEAATNFPEAPQRIPAIRRIEMLTELPIGVGTRFRETRVLYGREATEEMHVTAFERPHRYVVEAESCGCHFRSQFRFTPEDGRTMVELTVETRPLTTFAKVMGVLMRPMMGSMLKLCAADLQALRESLEKQPLQRA